MERLDELMDPIFRHYSRSGFLGWIQISIVAGYFLMVVVPLGFLQNGSHYLPVSLATFVLGVVGAIGFSAALLLVYLSTYLLPKETVLE